jgi:hypothetical protein
LERKEERMDGYSYSFLNYMVSNPKQYEMIYASRWDLYVTLLFFISILYVSEFYYYLLVVHFRLNKKLSLLWEAEKKKRRKELVGSSEGNVERKEAKVYDDTYDEVDSKKVASIWNDYLIICCLFLLIFTITCNSTIFLI